jgi:hypothetical protein
MQFLDPVRGSPNRQWWMIDSISRTPRPQRAEILSQGSSPQFWPSAARASSSLYHPVSTIFIPGTPNGLPIPTGACGRDSIGILFCHTPAPLIEQPGPLGPTHTLFVDTALRLGGLTSLQFSAGRKMLRSNLLRFVRFIRRPCLVRDPVDFPGFAPILRE